MVRSDSRLLFDGLVVQRLIIKKGVVVGLFSDLSRLLLDEVGVVDVGSQVFGFLPHYGLLSGQRF